MSYAERATSPAQVVCCMAGHIDHGKSSLVRALTGGVVDRLPEEKRRGMTVDLGFTHFSANGRLFAVTDVPGHEAFLHTMIAGAAGVDLALLVIAADDSVMPQTREHLAVLELLGVRRGVIAVTKCDLVGEEHLALVRLDIAELVKHTFLADAPVVNLSTRTGLGIDELTRSLVYASERAGLRPMADRRFRMPIDRAFSVAGQGTVVTGTVWRGTSRVGDALHVLPSAIPVRIRRMQSHGADVDSVSAGQRAAINIVGVKAADVRRGAEIVEPHAYESSSRLLVRLRMLPDAECRLKHRQLVRVHLGANKVTAQVLMEQRELAQGEDAFAMLRCGAPVVAEYAQPFVIRRLSPAQTLGGGTIISHSLSPSDRLRRCLGAGPDLASDDPIVRLAAYVELHREACFEDSTESRIGLNQQQFELAAQRLIDRGACRKTTGQPSRYVTTQRFDQLRQQMIRCCEAALEQRCPARLVAVATVLSAMGRHASGAVLNLVLDDLISKGELVRRDDRIGLPAGADLTNRQRQLLDMLLKQCLHSSRSPPTLKEFAALHDCSPRDLEPLVQLAVDDGRLVRVSPDLAMACEALEGMRQELAVFLAKHPAAKIGDIREHWGITRKHAVPVIEYFDRQHITKRSGETHAPGPRLSAPIDARLE